MAESYPLAGHGPRPQERGPHSKRSAFFDPSDVAFGMCRICRGEGTFHEPLFKPCRCSGSIQHVHQNCLMEWLSHSQKKYCELCKTPFRFTKFYNPDMPQSLPASVFFRQVTRYILENSLVYLRAIIALSFWLVVLPWTMRRGWSSMLWLSEQSWGSSNDASGTAAIGSSTVSLSSTLLGADTCPSSPLFAPTSTSSAHMATLVSWGSLTFAESFYRLLHKMFGLPLSNITPVRSDLSTSTSAVKSLLSNIHFLRNLTRNDTVNRTVISVLEGQIITIVVIVSFILVILVRDYVVQQQPELNMRGAFDVADAADAQAPVPVAVQPARPAQADETDDSDQDESQMLRPEVAIDPPARNEEDSEEDEVHNIDVHQRDRLLARMSGMDQSRHSLGLEVQPERHGNRLNTNADRDTNEDPPQTTHQAVGQSTLLPHRNPRWTEVGSSAQRLSDEESTDTILTPDHSQNDSADSGESTTGSKGKEKEVVRFPMPQSRSNSGGDAAADQGTASNTASASGRATTAHRRGGEETVRFSSQVPVDPGVGSSRPRAVSDGPQVSASNVHPLANNTWAFGPKIGDQPPNSNSDSHDHLSSDDEDWRHDLGGVSVEDLDIDAELEKLGLPPRVRPTDPVPSTSSTANGPAEDPANEPAHVQAQKDLSGPRPNVADRIADFMWADNEASDTQGNGDAPEEGGGDEGQWFDVHTDEEEDGEAEPHAAANERPPPIADAGAVPGNNAAEAALAADIDPEAIEDLEDFEGIMELLGIRGPITNLIQNVIFCAVLVQTALFACVFTPFHFGRAAFWFVAKPVRMVRILFEFSKVAQDLCFVIAGFLSWVAFNLIDMVTGHIGGPIASQVLTARKGSWGFFMGAGSRVGAFLEILVLDHTAGSGMQYWSAASHEALMSIKADLISFLEVFEKFLGSLSFRPTNLMHLATTAPVTAWNGLSTSYAYLTNTTTWTMEMSLSQSPEVDLAHAHWPAGDITWAIIAGYITLFTLAALYLRSGIRVARGTALEDWEAGYIDSLHQASGILKVITIISIEMLVFPLYCGVLLDCALLPLFGGASIKSRLLFTYNNPWTSIFVHWFVGTGYMFHFALFVSMCRKIMRPGVLYFIRDPDDPEFHPVRDVLERNLTTQLRKILFSAFVYGALVIVCLGGVVWGLASMAPNVLPIHYSSNEPVLEFPVDLLFYNFFMPLAVKVFKPGDGLHTMYRWCFRKSARLLRLTFFLFGERQIDEEGILQLAEGSPDRQAPAYRQAFLGLDAEKTVVGVKPWKDVFDGVNTRSIKSTPGEIKRLRHKRNQLIESGQLIKDGRFVRAPASDRVKIPKGSKVFLEVDERGRRMDDKLDEGLYASDQFQMVYVPPQLMTRISLFILFIWTFAAVTGVGLTIIPLVLGRMLFKMAIPNHVRTNDIYAFCIGIHVLGSVAYTAIHLRKLCTKARKWNDPKANGGTRARKSKPVTGVFIKALKVVYTYTFILVVCPLIMSLIVELYINIPVHTIMNPPVASEALQDDTEMIEVGLHTIRIVESWVLGLLYMRLAVKSVNSFLPGTRFARAMRTILHRGWLEPNVGVLTRGFVIPGLVLSTAAILGPNLIVRLLEVSSILAVDDRSPHLVVERVIRYRQAYPAMAVLAITVRYALVMRGGLNALKAKVRDDTYLLGEHLQNYDGSFPRRKFGRAQLRSVGLVE